MNSKVEEDSDVVIKPLTSLEEVLNWGNEASNNLLTSSVCLSRRSLGHANGLKTLVCHDMMGGYLEDRFIQGVSTSESYRFFHWSQVDMFVYFSHNFVTIPPPVWIDAAHTHGVPILGTIITEGGGGYALCKELLCSEDPYVIARFIQKLVQIAKWYNFDGWLINIENQIDEEDVKELQNVLHWLTLQMHRDVDGSIVLWYDSVLDNGELKWQNELNANNKIYFDVCDGIYLNYNWNEKLLQKSAELAGQRAMDVFAGIDVFGRGTFGGGGFDTDIAMKEARRNGLSVAIFAQGWTYERLGKLDFLTNEYKFWNRLVEFSNHRGPTDLPFSTSFCQGFGRCIYRCGELLHTDPWSNMSLQQYQASGQSVHNGEGDTSTLWIHDEDAYQGGSCVCLSGTWNSDGERKVLFKVLHSGLKCKSPLLITYTFKHITSESDELDVGLVLTVFSEGTEKSKAYHLIGSNISTFSSDNDISIIESKTLSTVLHPMDGDEAINLEEEYNVHIPAEHENGWVTRCYKMLNLTEEDIITDLDFAVVCTNNVSNSQQTTFQVLLGQLQIVPLDALVEQPPLNVKCTLVETIRSPSKMEVTSLVTWSEGADQRLVNSYDIFCQLKWAKADGGDRLTETRYVGTTRRCIYKMNNFPLTNPGNESFRIRFIVRENLIGLISKDVVVCAFDEASF